MEMVLSNGFCEMTMDEMLVADGGVDGWALASGLLSIAGGVLAVAAATGTDIVTCGITIPATTSEKLAGVCWVASGVATVISALND